ncbi:zinc ribbon domain-containing protein [Breznakiellaceae bacterium SP9]
MNCKKCNAEIAENAKFCLECGEKVEREPACSGCGAKLVPNTKFCPECGTKAGEAANTDAKQQPPEVPAIPAAASPVKESEEKQKVESLTRTIDTILINRTFTSIYWGENIPAKKLANLNKELSIPADEKVLLLYDDTLLGSAKEGAALTSWGIRFKESGTEWKCSWKTIHNYTVSPDNADEKKAHNIQFQSARDCVVLKLISAGKEFAPLMIKIIEEGAGIFFDEQAGEMEKTQITLVYEPNENFASMVNLFHSYLDRFEDIYDVQIKTKAEYETDMAKEGFSKVFGDEPAPEAESTDHIVFFGNIFNEYIKNINWVYNEFDMKYGWQGNKAAVFVGKRKWDESQLKQLTSLFEREQVVQAETKKKNVVGEQLDKLPTAAKIIGGGVLIGLGGGLIGLAAGTAYMIGGKINEGKVFENQLKYLANKFFTSGFTDFMGSNALSAQAKAEPAEKQEASKPQNNDKDFGSFFN